MSRMPAWQEWRRSEGTFILETKIDVSIDASGLLIWRNAVHSCHQRMKQVRLTGLDMSRIRIEPIPTLPGFSTAVIPCKRGACELYRWGPKVWPVLGDTIKCKDDEHKESTDDKFDSEIFPNEMAKEVEVVFRQLTN